MKNITFDFNEAVANFKKQYSNHMGFFDTSTPDGQKQLADFIEKNRGSFRSKYSPNAGTTVYVENGFSVPNIAMSNEIPANAIFPENPDKERMVNFMLTAGKFIVEQEGRAQYYEDGAPRRVYIAHLMHDALVQNTATDCFMILNGLKDGWLDRNDVETIALHRAASSLVGGKFASDNSITVYGIDKMMAEIDTGINVKKLSAREIKELTNKHAEHFEARHGDFKPLEKDDYSAAAVKSHLTAIVAATDATVVSKYAAQRLLTAVNKDPSLVQKLLPAGNPPKDKMKPNGPKS